MATSPTQLSLKKLRDEGWLAETVERWVPGANIRKDLWGFVDILAIRDDEILAVQATSYSNVSARVNKITDHENLPAVRLANIQIQVWGWRKVDNRWTARIVDIS
jgi:hypothetical protein